MDNAFIQIVQSAHLSAYILSTHGPLGINP